MVLLLCLSDVIETKVRADLTHPTGLIIYEVSDINFIHRYFIWLSRNSKKFGTCVCYFLYAHCGLS
jgi:predicted acetyltransferase